MSALSEVSALKYTLGFVWCPETNEVLLLNRLKAPWMGRWNGVGGKLEADELPEACIIRETAEETGWTVENYVSKGQLHWDSRNYNAPAFTTSQLVDSEVGDPTYIEVGGLYLFTATVTKEQRDLYRTPVLLVEGILDWKPILWIVNKKNVGVVDNIREYMELILMGCPNDIYKVVYRNNILVEHKLERNDLRHQDSLLTAQIN